MRGEWGMRPNWPPIYTILMVAPQPLETCTFYRIPCRLYIVQCAMYKVQCTLYILWNEALWLRLHLWWYHHLWCHTMPICNSIVPGVLTLSLSPIWFSYYRLFWMLSVIAMTQLSSLEKYICQSLSSQCNPPDKLSTCKTPESWHA